MDIRFDRYTVLDQGGERVTRLVFVSPDPDVDATTGVRFSEFIVDMVDTEITAFAVPSATPTPAQVTAFWNAILPLLNRKYRRAVVGTRLDPFIGQVRTV